MRRSSARMAISSVSSWRRRSVGHAAVANDGRHLDIGREALGLGLLGETKAILGGQAHRQLQ
jgi:hypothetical protein